MPVVNPLARELVFKIVYYGPGLGGKTTTLQYIHATTRPEHRGKMVSLATPVDRTLYFDFLPIRLPDIRGMGVRLQLFTVPGQVYYNATRKLVLTGADGVVFVADSQPARGDANVESLENLRDNLREHGRLLQEVPHILQYNKRDCEDVIAVEEMDQRLNPDGAPSFGTVATRGDNIFEALEAMTRSVLEDFESRLPEQKDSQARLVLPEGGIAEALRMAGPPTRLEVPTTSSFSSTVSDVHLGVQAPGEDAARGLVEAGHAREDSDAPLEVGWEVLEEPSPSTSLRAEVPSESEPLLEPEAVLMPEPISGPDPIGLPLPVAELQESRPAPTAPAREVAPDPAGWSFDTLWPIAERPTVQEIEACLERGQYARVVALADQAVARSLASAASLVGRSGDAPRDPAVVCLLLGIPGIRYLGFRATVREARVGHTPDKQTALVAYAFAIDVRIARTRVGA